MILLNPSGRGVSDEIASALRRDDELIDLKVSGLRQQVTAGFRPLFDAAFCRIYHCRSCDIGRSCPMRGAGYGAHR